MEKTQDGLHRWAGWVGAGVDAAYPDSGRGEALSGPSRIRCGDDGERIKNK